MRPYSIDIYNFCIRCRQTDEKNLCCEIDDHILELARVTDIEKYYIPKVELPTENEIDKLEILQKNSRAYTRNGKIRKAEVWGIIQKLRNLLVEPVGTPDDTKSHLLEKFLRID